MQTKQMRILVSTIIAGILFLFLLWFLLPYRSAYGWYHPSPSPTINPCDINQIDIVELNYWHEKTPCESPSESPSPTESPTEPPISNPCPNEDCVSPSPTPSETPSPSPESTPNSHDAGIDGSKAPEPNGIDCTKTDCSVHPSPDNFPNSNFDNSKVGWK